MKSFFERSDELETNGTVGGDDAKKMVDCASEWWTTLIMWDFYECRPLYTFVRSVTHSFVSGSRLSARGGAPCVRWNLWLSIEYFCELIWSRANFPFKSDKAIWDDFA
jgi:hypothetical protein